MGLDFFGRVKQMHASSKEKQIAADLAAIELAIDEYFIPISQNRHLFSNTFFDEIETIREGDFDPVMKLEYFQMFDKDDLIQQIRYFNQFLADDISLGLSETDDYFALSGDLINSLDQETVRRIIAGLQKQLSVKANTNLGWTAVAIVNKQNTLAGLSVYNGVSNQIKAMRHNMAIADSLSNDLFNIRFLCPGVLISETERRYIKFAWRLARTGVGDSSLTLRALFSLVYNNGACRAIPYNEASQLSVSCVHMFRERFGHNIWDPREAIAKIDHLRRTAVGDLLFNSESIEVRMQDKELAYTVS